METDGARALPHDVPAEVKLLDHAWLSRQTAAGARLTLLESRESTRMADAVAALESALAHSRAELASVQADRARLQGKLDVLERRS